MNSQICRSADVFHLQAAAQRDTTSVLHIQGIQLYLKDNSGEWDRFEGEKARKGKWICGQHHILMGSIQAQCTLKDRWTSAYIFCSSEHSLGEPWHKPQAWIVTQFTATSMTSRIKAWRILNLCSVPYDKSTPDGSECQLRSRALRKIDTNKRKQTCTLQQNGKTQNCIHVVLKSVEKKKAEWTFRSPDHHQHQCQTNTWVIILAG